MTKSERARELFLEGCNCSQAIFVAFAPDYGIDEKTAVRISLGLGGGVGRLREVCGAVSGASAIIGLHYSQGKKDGSEKEAVYAKVQRFAKLFKQQHPSVVCRDLLGSMAGTGSVPKARDEEFYRTRPCLHIIETAADILEKMLSEEE